MPGAKTSKKYTQRPSPPLPANDYCGQRKRGNDGKMWTSAMDKNGVCRWSRRAQTPAEKAGHGMYMEGPNKGDEDRWVAADKPLPTYVKKRELANKRKAAAARRRRSKSKSKSPARRAASRGRSASPCARGKKVVTRKAYTRADETRVKAVTYCRKK